MIKQSIEDDENKLSALRKEYKQNTQAINENKLKANKLQNELYKIKHNQCWISEKYNENELKSKFNSNIVKLKKRENELIENIKLRKGKIIKCNSIRYALNYINDNKYEELISELLERMKSIQNYLKKYYDSKSKLDSLLSNITHNNKDAKKYYTKQSFNTTEKNNKQSFDILENDNININNNKNSFNIQNSNNINVNNNDFNMRENNNISDNKKSFINLNNKKINTNNNINISDNKSLFNKTEVNNVINKIQKLCEELDFQKENIKYYIVFLKEIMQQIFNNNTSDKNKVNQFV